MVAQGSGVVIAEGGYVLTNYHVIEDGTAYQVLMPNGEKVKVTQDLAEAIYEDLIGSGYVKRGELTDKYYADKASGIVQVAEEVKDCAASVVSILSTIYDSHSVEFEDAHGNNVEAKVDPDKLKKKEFLALWEKINQKSFYTVSFDTKDLIQKAIDKLNGHLEVSRIFVKKEYGEQTGGEDPVKGSTDPGRGFQAAESRSGDGRPFRTGTCAL